MFKLGSTILAVLSAAFEGLRLGSMVDILWNIVERNLPHTYARLVHLVYLLSDANLELYHLLDALTWGLPLYLWYFHEEIRIFYSGPWIPEPIFDDIITSLFWLYYVL